jgi:hypothetical protein
MVREVNSVKTRSLHNHPILSVKRIIQPDNILVGRPDRIEIILNIDEIRNSHAHELDRSDL